MTTYDLQIPEEPPIKREIKTKKPEDYGLTSSAEMKRLCDQYEERAYNVGIELVEIDKEYGVRLIFPYDGIPRQYWDKPLTDLQRRFKRGTPFTEIVNKKRTKFISAGLTFDTALDDYVVYNYNANERPVGVLDRNVHWSQFESDDRTDGIDKLNIEF